MFTQNDLTNLYRMLDQAIVRGEDQKEIVLTLMRKIRGAITSKVPDKPSEPEDPSMPEDKMLDGPTLSQDEPTA